MILFIAFLIISIFPTLFNRTQLFHRPNYYFKKIRVSSLYYTSSPRQVYSLNNSTFLLLLLLIYLKKWHYYSLLPFQVDICLHQNQHQR